MRHTEARSKVVRVVIGRFRCIITVLLHDSPSRERSREKERLGESFNYWSYSSTMSYSILTSGVAMGPTIPGAILFIT